MQKWELTELIEKLCNYYERKDPKDETIAEWMERCGTIPSVASKWMVDKIKDRYETFPKNIPSVLRGLWNEWVQANPDKIAKQEFRCKQPECKDGFLYVRKDTYSYIFRCMECNARQDYPAIPGGTLYQLELDGYKTGRSKPVLYDAKKWKKAPENRLDSILEAAKMELG